MVTGQNETMVDALEEGFIVTVPEIYAIREGLHILHRFKKTSQTGEETRNAQTSQRIENVKIAPFESLRKPLKRQQNNVLASLSDNFHWELQRKRREKNMTRRQVGQAVGASEYEVKMLENGVLPSDDFILISRLEKYFGISLRREGLAEAPKLLPKHAARKEGEERRTVAGESRKEKPVKELPTSNKESMVGDIEIALDE